MTWTASATSTDFEDDKIQAQEVQTGLSSLTRVEVRERHSGRSTIALGAINAPAVAQWHGHKGG